MQSMKKMKELAPQLEKLKKKHKGDKLKLSQAQAEFYRQKGINPGAGCIPYLIQILILIAFFNVFTRTLSPNGDMTVRFNELLYQPLKFSQEEKINTKFLYLDIARPDVFRLTGVPFSLPGPLLILAALVQFLSAKATAPQSSIEKSVAKKTSGSVDDMQVAMQKSMTFTFPFLTLVFGMRFPSGLALYWFLFSLWQLLQQSQGSGSERLKSWVKSLNLLKSKKSK